MLVLAKSQHNGAFAVSGPPRPLRGRPRPPLPRRRRPLRGALQRPQLAAPAVRRVRGVEDAPHALRLRNGRTDGFPDGKQKLLLFLRIFEEPIPPHENRSEINSGLDSLRKPEPGFKKKK